MWAFLCNIRHAEGERRHWCRSDGGAEICFIRLESAVPSIEAICLAKMASLAHSSSFQPWMESTTACSAVRTALGASAAFSVFRTLRVHLERYLRAYQLWGISRPQITTKTLVHVT